MQLWYQYYVNNIFFKRDLWGLLLSHVMRRIEESIFKLIAFNFQVEWIRRGQSWATLKHKFYRRHMGLSLQYEDLRIIQKNYHRAFYTGMLKKCQAYKIEKSISWKTIQLNRKKQLSLRTCCSQQCNHQREINPEISLARPYNENTIIDQMSTTTIGLRHLAWAFGG